MTYKVPRHQPRANVPHSLTISLLLAHPVPASSLFLQVDKHTPDSDICTCCSLCLKGSLHCFIHGSLTYLIKVFIQVFPERLPLRIPSKIVTPSLPYFFYGASHHLMLYCLPVCLLVCFLPPPPEHNTTDLPCPSHHLGMQGEVCNQERAQPRWHPDPGLPVSRTVREEFPLLAFPITQPVASCYSSPNRLRHLTTKIMQHISKCRLREGAAWPLIESRR